MDKFTKKIFHKKYKDINNFSNHFHFLIIKLFRFFCKNLYKHVTPGFLPITLSNLGGRLIFECNF